MYTEIREKWFYRKKKRKKEETKSAVSKYVMHQASTFFYKIGFAAVA